MREDFAAGEAALQGGKSAEVGRVFGCRAPAVRPRDHAGRMQGLADIVVGTVQYNEEGAGLSIAALCDIMTNRSEAYEEEMEAYDRLVKLVQVRRDHTHTLCTTHTHT